MASRFPIMHHSARFVRSLFSLVGRVQCGRCRLAADVVNMALGRDNATKGRYVPRLTVEAICPTCGYQTIYYEAD